MPATFLGGVSPNPVYLIGRDDQSGTRISVEKDINFVGNPLLWTTNGAGNYILTNGLSSGGLLRDVVKGKSDAIGYVGLSDYAAVSNFVSLVAFNGVPFSHTNVNIGAYSLWGCEHMVNKVGGLSAQKLAVRDAVKAAISNTGFQSTNSLYAPFFSSQNDMQVDRGSDGAVPISTVF
jgi:ABC-type phosphate transport system substrate-binding protein